jgi:hypothetical protein
MARLSHDPAALRQVALVRREVEGEGHFENGLRGLELAHGRRVGSIDAPQVRLVQGIAHTLLVPSPRFGDGLTRPVEVARDSSAVREHGERLCAHVPGCRLVAHSVGTEELNDLERKQNDVRRLLRVAGAEPTSGIEERPEESAMVPVLVLDDCRESLAREGREAMSRS